jgi:hypothetical protein
LKYPFTSTNLKRVFEVWIIQFNERALPGWVNEFEGWGLLREFELCPYGLVFNWEF